MRDSYGTGLICTSGHQATGLLEQHPEILSDHCTMCGARMISKCPKCEEPIRGSHTSYPSRDGGTSYCHACGAAYPWTEARLDAAGELAAMDESLSDTERELLRENFPFLGSDNPRVEVAAVQVGRILAKAEPAVRRGLLEIAKSFATSKAAELLAFTLA